MLSREWEGLSMLETQSTVYETQAPWLLWIHLFLKRDISRPHVL